MSGDELTVPGYFDAGCRSDYECYLCLKLVRNCKPGVGIPMRLAAPIVSKVVYMAMPMEAINPEYYTDNRTCVRTEEPTRRDNAQCWRLSAHRKHCQAMCRSSNGGHVPVKGRIPGSSSQQHRLNSDGTQYVAATTYTSLRWKLCARWPRCQWHLYSSMCFKAGFVTSHGQAGLFHGGYQTETVELLIAEAKPGDHYGHGNPERVAQHPHPA
jgi:hypothetical protein